MIKIQLFTSILDAYNSAKLSEIASATSDNSDGIILAHDICHNQVVGVAVLILMGINCHNTTWMAELRTSLSAQALIGVIYLDT